MKKIMKCLAIVLSGTMLAGCGGAKDDAAGNMYANDDMWCCKPTECTEKVDVFYIVSTNIMRSYNADSTESQTAVLNDEEKAILAGEINTVHEGIFPEKLNYFAPYYHQMTMGALSDKGVTKEQKLALEDKTKQELFDAFDYYMDNLNGGRPFVLAGYSQGAIMTKEILKHMTAGQKKQMVAAYMIGFGLDAKTLEHPNIVAAEGELDTGVTVSFNSVANLDAIYAGLLNNAVACINPINWHTDATPGSIEYDGDTLTAHVDQDKKVLIVEGFHPERHDVEEWDINPWSNDNYHNFEIYFYNPSLRKNVLDRAESFLKK